MVHHLQGILTDLRNQLQTYVLSSKEEIFFFKNQKPELLSRLLYFHKIYSIEAQCPTGSNEVIKLYINKELNNLTYFFNRNLDFYQYYISHSTIYDEHYFLHGNTDIRLYTDSAQLDKDPNFSTGYDYKVAKILANEMLRIYLNKKLQKLENESYIEKQYQSISTKIPIRFTGKKAALIELCYALVSSGDINQGNIEIKEFMNYLSTIFNIDLGGYYDAYIAMKERKDRTSYSNKLIENLSKTVVSVNNVPLGTYDNLFCITGGEGTGKSNFISAIIAGTLIDETTDLSIDTLGLDICPNYNQKAILHYDTEQSEYQLYKNLSKTLKRVGIDSVPETYHTFYLASMSRKERLQIIRDSMDLYYHRQGGIHLVVIDGIADLIRSANDETESIAIVDELYRLAGIYKTCIICVLHFVPNGIKLRGHIGSELQRKAAAILSIEKDENPAYSVVKAIKVRDGSPLDVPMLLFTWDKTKDMHVYAGEKSIEDKEKRKRTELSNITKEIFKSRKKVSYNDLTELIMDMLDVKERTAKSYIRYMKENGMLSQDSSNYYIIGNVSL